MSAVNPFNFSVNLSQATETQKISYVMEMHKEVLRLTKAVSDIVTSCKNCKESDTRTINNILFKYAQNNPLLITLNQAFKQNAISLLSVEDTLIVPTAEGALNLILLQAEMMFRCICVGLGDFQAARELSGDELEKRAISAQIKHGVKTSPQTTGVMREFEEMRLSGEISQLRIAELELKVAEMNI